MALGRACSVLFEKLVSAPRKGPSFNRFGFIYTMELVQQPQWVPSARRLQISTQNKVKAEIMFGNPSMGCQGVGICQVLSYGQETTSKCPKVTAWISTTAEGKLRFRFLKSSMDKAYIRKHFGWRLFQVYTTYELSGKVASKLGLVEAKVMPGIYTVWETSRHFVVDF